MSLLHRLLGKNSDDAAERATVETIGEEAEALEARAISAEARAQELEIQFAADRAEWNERITGFETQLAELKAAAEEAETEFKAQLAEKDAALAEKNDLIAELEAEYTAENIADTVREAMTSDEEAVAPIRDTVAALVTAELAKAGHPPVEVSFKPAANSVTREQFNAMTPREKSEFSKNGGKIAEPATA